MVQEFTFEDNIIHSSNFDYTPEVGGCGQTIFNALKKYGDSIAQIDGLTGEKDTCASYLQRCIRTAIKMRSKGIQKGDIVSISCYNHLNSSVPYLAALFLGVKTANIDPTVTLEETVHLLKQVEPKMIFIESEHINHFEKAILGAEVETQLVIFGKTSKYVLFSEFLEECEEENSFRPVEITDLMETAIIIFSSGSTGFPKGICLSYYAMGFYCSSPKLLPFDKLIILAFSSIYWISQVIIISVGIVGNSPRVILPQFDEKIIWQVVDKYKANVAVMSPSHAISMFKKKTSHLDSSSLRLLLIGGAKIAEDILSGFHDVLPNARFIQAYGMTEISGLGLQFNAKIQHTKEKLCKSIGQPIPGLSYKVVDVNTEKPLGPNQPGELRIKSPIQMNGYYNVDSSDMWDSDGWLKTGDMIYYDEEFYFYYVERIKEMIKYRGHQVFPGVLENIMLSHPKINAAVVVGVAHPEDGDLPTAIVVLKELNNGGLTAEEIEKYVEERVDHKSRLRGGVKIVSEIPHATSGKPKRKVIRELLRDGKL